MRLRQRTESEEIERLRTRLDQVEADYAHYHKMWKDSIGDRMELGRVLRDAIANIDPDTCRDYPYWRRLVEKWAP